MGFFRNFPYTNYHDLNLDFILKQMVNLQNEFSNYQALNYVSYGGVWDISKNYKKWTIVTIGNASYISLVPVPPNVDIKNSEYWLKAADLDPRYEQIIDDVANIYNDIEIIDKRIDSTELDITTIREEIKKLPKKSMFMSSFADPTGIKDCSEDVKKISENITLIVDSGNYRIDGDITFGDNINVIFVGGVIKCSGTLTIKNFTAGKYRIVDADRCVFGNGSMIGYPEWFGAKADGETDCADAMKLAVETLGKVVLDNGIYNMSKELVIGKPVQIVGNGMWNGLRPYTLLRFSSNRGVVVYSEGFGLENVVIKSVTISTVGGIGLAVNGANRGIFEDIFVYNSNPGYDITRTVGCVFNRCYAYVDFVGASVGFNLHGSVKPGWPFIGDNASLFIQNCKYIGLEGNSDNAMGIYGYNSNGDLFIDNFEASQVKCGILLDGSNSQITGNIDIHITRAIIDLYTESGIEVRNMQPTSCTINDCYVAPKEQNTKYSNGIFVNACHNVTVTNCTVHGGYIVSATDKYRGIMLNFAQNIIMTGNIITNFSIGILIFGRCINIKSGNTVVPNSGNQSIIVLNSGGDCSEYVNFTDSVRGGVLAINGANLVKITVDTATLNGVQILLNGAQIQVTTGNVVIR